MSMNAMEVASSGKNVPTKNFQTPDCPICGASPVSNGICPATCGSLEGLSGTRVKTPSRTFGFDWASGFVAPFLGVQEEAAMEALQAAGVGEEDYVVDLGCGDGRICRAACSLGAQATGYDLDQQLIAQAKTDNGSTPETSIRASFYVKDLFQVDLNPYNVVTIFLLPETAASPRLGNKLLDALLQRKSRIISFGWKIPWLGEPTATFRPSSDSPTNTALTKRWFVYGGSSKS
jgi:SAM-dependent methyltransferase